MVKLPMSEYVANYYKGQGIEFTLRQQATLCWNGHRPGCIYIFIPDDEDEYYRQYFSSVEAAISYGITHCKDEYQIENHYLFEIYPKEFLDKEDDKDNYITKIAYY